MYVLVAQLCLALCDPIHCSPPGFSVHGILQARILEWVAISFSRDLPDTQRLNLGSPALQAGSLPTEPQGKPLYVYVCIIKKEIVKTLWFNNDFEHK